jgi:hypothetical protein
VSAFFAQYGIVPPVSGQRRSAAATLPMVDGFTDRAACNVVAVRRAVMPDGYGGFCRYLLLVVRVGQWLVPAYCRAGKKSNVYNVCQYYSYLPAACPQTHAVVTVLFNNPNTPRCTLQVPVSGTGCAWLEVAAYLQAHGVDHPALDYNFSLDAVRSLALGTLTTTL